MKIKPLMRRIIFCLRFLTFIILVGCLGFVQSCQDLPEVSQTGAGTFGMLINGKSWRGDGPIGAGPYSDVSYWYAAKGLQIRSIITRQNGSQEKFNIVITNLNATGQYVMGNFPYLKSIDDSTRFWYNDNEWAAYKLRLGVPNSIEITRFDTLMEIISGKFSVNLVDRKNDTLRLTDGRFDLQFTSIH